MPFSHAVCLDSLSHNYRKMCFFFKFIVGGYSCLKNHILISCIVHTPKNCDNSVLRWSWSSVYVCVCVCTCTCIYVCFMGFGGVGACMCECAHACLHIICGIQVLFLLWRWSVITLTCAVTLPGRLSYTHDLTHYKHYNSDVSTFAIASSQDGKDCFMQPYCLLGMSCVAS